MFFETSQKNNVFKGVVADSYDEMVRLVPTTINLKAHAFPVGTNFPLASFSTEISQTKSSWQNPLSSRVRDTSCLNGMHNVIIKIYSHDFLCDGLLLFTDGPVAPNGGCFPANAGCCVDDAYTDGGRAGYPCVLPGNGSRWGFPAFCVGRGAKSAKSERSS